jgi:magnesium-transporting ATPase (P-type)
VTNKKRFLVAFVLLILIFVGWAASRSYSNKYNSYIDLVVTPLGSKVMLDGRGVKASKLRLPAGEHTLAASRDGFAMQTKKVNLNPNETRFVGFALLSNSAETKDWYEQHPEDQLMLESISSRSFDQSSKDIVKRYPIIKELPFIDQFYRVDYGQPRVDSSDPTAISIYITYYSKSGKQQALDWLKFKGYTPKDIEVQFIDKTP